MQRPSFPRLLVAVALCEFVGALGAIFTAPSIPIWYATLTKPYFTPPDWVFMPVWTTLFALMGVALWLVAESGVRPQEKRAAHKLFVFQLALNVAWSFIFFGLHAVSAALIEIISLWLAIFALILVFAKISKLAAYLLIPYILWVTLAFYLNLGIWLLNA